MPPPPSQAPRRGSGPSSPANIRAGETSAEGDEPCAGPGSGDLLDPPSPPRLRGSLRKSLELFAPKNLPNWARVDSPAGGPPDCGPETPRAEVPALEGGGGGQDQLSAADSQTRIAMDRGSIRVPRLDLTGLQQNMGGFDAKRHDNRGYDAQQRNALQQSTPDDETARSSFSTDNSDPGTGVAWCGVVWCGEVCVALRPNVKPLYRAWVSLLSSTGTMIMVLDVSTNTLGAGGLFLAAVSVYLGTPPNNKKQTLTSSTTTHHTWFP